MSIFTKHTFRKDAAECLTHKTIRSPMGLLRFVIGEVCQNLNEENQRGFL